MASRRFGPSWFRVRESFGPRHSGRAPLLLSAVIGVGLALLCIKALDATFRPVLTDMAVARTRNAVTELVNRAVEETLAAEGLGYDDMVTLRTDGGGRITAMTTDTVRLNALRTAVLGRVTEAADALDVGDLGIPLGNLTGVSLASDRGPTVPVRVAAVASSDAAFENSFSAAGINQTLHRIMLDVSVTVRILIPGDAIETEVKAQVCVAETVVVGDVPGTYLQMEGT